MTEIEERRGGEKRLGEYGKKRRPYKREKNENRED